MESYVSGSLRFNRRTLQDVSAWLWNRVGNLWEEIQRVPAHWVELRLSLQQADKRTAVLAKGLLLGLVALVLGLLDRVAASVLRRKISELGIGARPSWLMMEPAAAAPPVRG